MFFIILVVLFVLLFYVFILFCLFHISAEIPWIQGLALNAKNFDIFSLILFENKDWN